MSGDAYEMRVLMEEHTHGDLARLVLRLEQRLAVARSLLLDVLTEIDECTERGEQIVGVAASTWHSIRAVLERRDT